jgi:hypothetical protein
MKKRPYCAVEVKMKHSLVKWPNYASFVSGFAEQLGRVAETGIRG